MLNVSLSSHASQRSAQRNLSDADIAFILQNGSRVHRTGVIFCQLRHKDVPEETPGNHRHRQLVGTTVVLSKCGHYVITVYRDAKAFQRDIRKSKYNNLGQSCALCSCVWTPPQGTKSSQTIAIGCA